MSTVDDVNGILGEADLQMNEGRGSMLHRLNVDPRWSIADKNFDAIARAFQLMAERIDELEAKLAAR